MTNVIIDSAIYAMQPFGGISTLWRAITPLLPDLLPECTFDPAQPADVFLSTYYQPAPPGAKSVVVVYDYIQERYPGLSSFAPDALWKRSAVAAADAVVAISKWTADDVLRFDGKVASVAYLSTSLDRASDDEVRAFRRLYKIDYPYVLIMGRRSLYKNFNTYIQALRVLGSQRGFGTLCVGGEETIGPASVDALLARPMSHRALPPEHLAAAYTGALCLVYPSLYEGFGLPVLEAYSCGCPVICGDGGALAEINEAALVVNITAPREIAQALVAMSNPGVRIEHILKGYEVAQRFSWQQPAQQIAASIRSVMEREAA